MNWDSIKYIFQIPLGWYEKIHKRVFNAYGTNFLIVREGFYGGMEVGIDSDGFAAEVNRAVDLSGYVKSVDDQTPDENGNVELSGVVKTIDGEQPDEYGNIELSDYYVTIDTEQTITGEKTFSQTINLSPYGTLESEDQYVRLAYGSTNGIAIVGTGTDRQQLLDDEPARLYSTGADNQIATRGYCRLNFARKSEVVKSVNDILPDLTGNVDLGNLVYSVNNITPDANGNIEINLSGDITMQDVEDYVTTYVPDYVDQQDFTTLPFVTSYVVAELVDYAMKSDLTNYVLQSELTAYALTSQLTNYVKQNDLTSYVQRNDLTSYVQRNEITDFITEDEVENYVDLQLLDYVKSVDSITPDISGNVNFNLTSNKWMKTDSNGHIATTNEIPISLSAGNTGYLYANNGSLEFKQDEFVTLSTAQVITGSKVFENKQYFQKQNDAGGTTAIDGEVVSINGGGGVPGITMLYGSGVGGQITRGQSGLQLQDTYMVGLNAPTAILLSSAANGVVLGTQPTDTSTTSKAVATVGYVQSNCVTLDKTQYTPQTGSMTFVTGVSWNGTQLVISRVTITFTNGVATSYTTLANQTIDTVAFSTT